MRSRINKRTSKPKKNILSNLSNLSNLNNIEINYHFLIKLSVVIILYIILFFGMSSFLKRSIAIKQFENSIEEFAQNNSETIFEIKEITLYTSASAKKNAQTPTMDISTFTDISFYIDNPKNKIINSLKIENINIETEPEIGEPVINYKNPYDFGKLTDFELDSANSIEFKVLDEETSSFEKPVVYNNLSTPITLTYLNKNVRTSFQVMRNETSIYYDGRLLNVASVDLTRLSATISFDVIINDQYTCKLFVSIPYKTDISSIMDGYVMQVIPLNGTAKFYQL